MIPRWPPSPVACWLRTGRSCRGGLSYACLEDLDQAQAFITRALEADPERLFLAANSRCSAGPPREAVGQ